MGRSAQRVAGKAEISRRADGMPIEELARRTGMTVRNLRAMHSRGLLAPPGLVGRKGFYTERHVARVLLVLKLQSRGFSLASIVALVKSWETGSGLVAVMGLEDAVATAGLPEVQPEEDVERTFPELVRDDRALAKALAQELVVRRDGRLVAPNAELLDIVRQQVAAGYPLRELLAEGDVLVRDLERIAARFRKSFFRHFVDPYFAPGALGTGVADVADVAEKVALLRPLSQRAVAILLARAIERGGGAPPQGKGKGAQAKGKRAARKPKKGKRS